MTYKCSMRRTKLVSLMALLNLVLLAIVLWQAVLLRQQKTAYQTAHRLIEQSKADVRLAFPSPTARVATTPSETTNSAGPVNGSRDALLQDVAAPLTNSGKPKPDWRQVESADYRTYVKNLRDIGCPETTIRDIVSADLQNTFAARRAEIMAARYRDFKYWQTGPEEAAARQELERQRRALDTEVGSALSELVGS